MVALKFWPNNINRQKLNINEKLKHETIKILMSIWEQDENYLRSETSVVAENLIEVYKKDRSARML